VPDRATLTARYLDEVAYRGARGSELLNVMPTTGMLAAKYQRRYLTRPLFIGRAECDSLNSDLQQVRSALVSLPDRLYGGDLPAFARAAGMTDDQAEAVLRSRAGQVTQLARADLYPETSGLRLLEFNMGSGVAGIDNADICRAMLRHPVLKDFARAHRLHYVDTMREQVSMIFGETGFAPGSVPMMAVADWPDHYRIIGPFLHKIARRWRALGLDAHACHIGELKASGGRVRLRGRPVDIIFRIFLIEHLLEPEGHALMDPVIDAVARGEVTMFTPLDSELYGSKAPLAMLSDDANRHLFTAAELAAFDRVLPWTRMARPGPVTLEDGRTVDLLDYGIGHADDLVLKPTLLHGGLGVLPGWHRDISARQWRDRLTSAMGGPYVIQRRIRPDPELCPGESGQPVPWIVTWGVFTLPAGYGGVFARAYPAGSGLEVARAGSGLLVGCCLAQQPDRPAANAAATGPETLPQPQPALVPGAQA
jgi:hypothetical protein